MLLDARFSVSERDYWIMIVEKIQARTKSAAQEDIGVPHPNVVMSDKIVIMFLDGVLENLARATTVETDESES